MAVSSIVRTTAGNTATSANSVAYTVTFDAAVTGVDLGDFSLSKTGTADGILSSLSGSGSTYTVGISNITGDGTLRLDLNSSGTQIKNGAGEDIQGGYTSGESYTFDHTGPAISSVAVPASATYTVGQSMDFTANFNEAVTVVGAPQIGLTIGNTSVPATYLSGSGSTSLVFRATIGSGLRDTDGITIGTIDLNGGTIRDEAGNIANLSLNGVASTANVLVDSAVPILAQPIAISDTALKIGDSATATFIFTEAVTGFTTADVTVPNGTLSNPVTADGGRTWTATLTPTAGASNATNVLTLDYTGVADLAGNTGTGTADSGNYAVDTVRPSLASSIAISDTALKIGDSATATFTFTEAVTGFTTADVTVPNGTLSNLASSDGGRTWTATLTPAAGTSAATNVLTLDYSGVADLAGNTGTGTVDSGNYAVDTKRPTSTITLSDSALTSNETSTVSIKFSEEVTGFDLAGLTGSNGTLSTLTRDASDRTLYTATLTPNANTSAATNAITLDNASVSDLSGNAGIGTMMSGNYTIDTLVPVTPPTTPPDPTPSIVSGGATTNSTTTTDPAAAQAAAVQALQSLPAGLDRAALDQAISDFLLGLPAGTTVNVSTFTPTPGATDIRIDGPTNGTQTVVILNASSVPPGTLVTLNNVGFVVLSGPASLVGGEGSQVVFAGDGSQSMVLGADDDTLHGGSGNDVIGSKGGNDVLHGDAGDDTVFGGIGNDTLHGGADQDLVYGNQDNDLIYGNQGQDSLYGGQGDDRAYGGQGDDRLYGNLGNDVLFGNIGADLVYGNQGNDIVYGSQGADILFGGQDNDVLYGGQDNDTLVGGVGDDTLVGGLGADLYRFDTNSGRDLILGFNQADGDRIALGGQTYTVSSAQNGDALLTLSGGGVVDLAGIRADQVNASYFAA